VSCIPDMTPTTSLVVAVAPGTCIFIKKEERIFYKMVYYTLYLG